MGQLRFSPADSDCAPTEFRLSQVCPGVKREGIFFRSHAPYRVLCLGRHGHGPQAQTASEPRSPTAKGVAPARRPPTPLVVRSGPRSGIRPAGPLVQRPRDGEIDSVVSEEYPELKRRLQENFFSVILEEVALVGVEGTDLEVTSGRYPHPVEGFSVRDR